MQILWDQLQQTDDQEVLDNLNRSVHNLAGSAGTFGFPALSQHTRELEKTLLQLRFDYNLDGEMRESITNALDNISGLARADPDIVYQDLDCRPQAEVSVASDTDKQLIYVVEDDLLLAEELSTQLTHFGYEVQVFADCEAARLGVSKQLPKAMIVDVNLPTGELSGPAFFKEVTTDLKQEIPVIFISNRDDWEAHLAAVRAGGDDYLSKPIVYGELLDKLDVLLQSEYFDPYRVIIIDDMPLLAEHYALVLRERGMLVEVLTNPAGLFELLKEFNAELILMDIYMPGCTGLEAAKIVRQKDELAGIPIVFLSTESDSLQQVAAMKLGADDFLQKPVEDEQLFSSASLRVERFRKLRSMMFNDSLTGLLNHVAIKTRLKTELALAVRQKRSLVFAMIDIDRFKSVNDRYGHQVGDRVIKSLSRLLQQRLRQSDILGRYGGEEFALILPDTDISNAEELINNLRHQFGEIMHQHEGEQFACSFSAGLATSFNASEDNELINAADVALYEAKKSGRNRIKCAG